MPLLDIEQIINQKDLKSRFRLVHLAGLRARELNAPTDETMSSKSDEYYKITTNALNEIINKRVKFEEIDD